MHFSEGTNKGFSSLKTGTEAYFGPCIFDLGLKPTALRFYIQTSGSDPRTRRVHYITSCGRLKSHVDWHNNPPRSQKTINNSKLFTTVSRLPCVGHHLWRKFDITNALSSRQPPSEAQDNHLFSSIQGHLKVQAGHHVIPIGLQGCLSVTGELWSKLLVRCKLKKITSAPH